MIVGKSKEFASKTLNIDGGEVLLVSIERNGMGLISLNGSKACKFHWFMLQKYIITNKLRL